MNDNTKGSFPYKAFISYRWRAADSAAARWLQENLETYRVPSGVHPDAVRQNVKLRLGKVFRDDTDMRAGPDLPGEIEARLAQSEWLIVICSTETPGSDWVAKEVDYFIQHRGRDHIVPVLVDGSSDESFPEQLRSPPELLAADMRIKPGRRKRAGRRHALLQVLATLLDVEYDTLANREAVQRAHRWQAVAAGIATLAVGLGTLTGLYLLQREETAIESERANSAAAVTDFAHGRESEAAYLFEGAARSFAHSLGSRPTSAARAGLVRSLVSPSNVWNASRSPTVDSRECIPLHRDHIEVVPNRHAVAFLDGPKLLLLDFNTGTLVQQILVGNVVRAFRFSRDGSLLALGEKEGRIRIIQVEGLNEIGRLREADQITALDFSPDNRLLAVGHATGMDVYIWRDGDRIHGLGDSHFREAALTVAFAPNEPLLAWTASKYAFISRPLQDSYDRISQDPEEFTAAQWSNDGSMIIFGARSGNLEVFRRGKHTNLAYAIISGREPTHPQLQTIKGHPGGISALTFFGQDGLFATSGADGIARIWSSESLQQLFALTVSSQPLCGLAAFESGGLVIVSEDGQFRAWELGGAIGHHVGLSVSQSDSTGDEWQQRVGLSAVSDIKTTDDRILALSTNGTLSVFPIRKTQEQPIAPIASVETGIQVGELALSPSGTDVLVRPRALDSGEMVGSKTLSKEPIFSLGSPGSRMALPSEYGEQLPTSGSFLASPDRLLMNAGTRLEFVRWPPLAAGTEQTQSLQKRLFDATSEIRAFAHSKDGTRILVVTSDGVLTLIDTTSRSPQPRKIGTAHDVRRIVISPSGTYAGIYRDSGVGRLEGWDLANGKKTFDLGIRLSDLEPVSAIANIEPALAVDRDRGRVALFDLRGGDRFIDWQSFEGPPISAWLDAEHRQLLIGLSVRPEGKRVIRIGYGWGLERLESRVILSAAPICEVPYVDDEKPPPLRP